MALSTHDISYLAEAGTRNFLTGRTLCLGRPTILAQAWETRSILSDNKIAANESLDVTQGEFADDLIVTLGAGSVEAVDISEYEGADHIWDLSKPYIGSLTNSFNTVIDAGTLEHVFDFPAALRNVFGWLKPGGTAIFLTHANNFMGHGFYQFSPELFTAICCEGSDAEVLDMVIHENQRNARWHDVMFPEKVNSRITLCNKRQTFLKVVIRKKGDNILNSPPLQRDWQPLHAGRQDRAGKRTFKTYMASLLEGSFPHLLHQYRRWRIESSQCDQFRPHWFKPRAGRR